MFYLLNNCSIDFAAFFPSATAFTTSCPPLTASPAAKYFLLAELLKILIATFAVSGALHDLALGLMGLGWGNFLTIWFIVMGVYMNLSKFLDLHYTQFSFFIRAVINTSSIAFCFFLATLLT